jgi:hypothetical protein
VIRDELDLAVVRRAIRGVMPQDAEIVDEGFDSMLFLFIALDPWLKKQVTIDSTAPYRYQRFLYPLLASTVSP